MQLTVYSKSETFNKFIDGIFPENIEFRDSWSEQVPSNECVHMVHLVSMGKETQGWLRENAQKGNLVVAICSDMPNVLEMLQSTQYGAKAYCNSFMQTAHYQQMIRLLANGQSWFPPHLLGKALELAYKAVDGSDESAKLDMLTSREKDIALAVSKGLSNKEIAEQYDISERTVKAHLTNIFKKLEIKDRVGLVLFIKQ